MSRTEAFLQYAEEHPHEILEVLEDRTEALVRELEARERNAARELTDEISRDDAAGDIAMAYWRADDLVPF